MTSGKSWAAFGRELLQGVIVLMLGAALGVGVVLYAGRQHPMNAIDQAIREIEEFRKRQDPYPGGYGQWYYDARMACAKAHPLPEGAAEMEALISAANPRPERPGFPWAAYDQVVIARQKCVEGGGPPRR